MLLCMRPCEHVPTHVRVGVRACVRACVRTGDRRSQSRVVGDEYYRVLEWYRASLLLTGSTVRSQKQQEPT